MDIEYMGQTNVIFSLCSAFKPCISVRIEDNLCAKCLCYKVHKIEGDTQ